MGSNRFDKALLNGLLSIHPFRLISVSFMICWCNFAFPLFRLHFFEQQFGLSLHCSSVAYIFHELVKTIYIVDVNGKVRLSVCDGGNFVRIRGP